MESPEEIILDVNTLAEGYEFYSLGGLSVSPDNRLVAYGEDTLSRRIYTLKVKDLVTGKLLSDEIQNTEGSVTWANDNQTFFYTSKDETLRPHQIWKHKIGTPASGDQLVYEEKDETFRTFVYKTKSRKYIVIGSSSTIKQ